MRLLRNDKVVPLYRRRATVQNVLRHTLTENEYVKVMVVGMDKDGYLYHAHSHMRYVEAVGMAEYLKAAVMKKMMEET